MSQPLIHPSAILDPGCHIGEGTRIWHHVHVTGGARIGRDCMLGQGCFVAATVQLGDRCRVQNHVSLYDGVILEEEVFLGPSCVFTNVRYPRAHVSRKAELATTRVGRGATIGANATVVCGVTIGAYAMVGAGAVVTHSLPPHALAVGTPARRVGWVCRCGEPLRERGEVACPRCGACYLVDDDHCQPLEA